MTRPSFPVLLLALLAVARADAQTPAPAHISVVEGTASVARLSGSEAAEADMPLEPGDRVRTAEGHLEIITGDGSAVHLDAQTTIDVSGAGVLRLLGGRVVVASAPRGADSLQIDALPASVRLTIGSEGRLSLFQDAQGVFLDVAMVRGDAQVLTATSVASVTAGERVVVRNGQAPSDAIAFNSAESDAFYDWSNGLLDTQRGTTSAEYLPADLTTYGATFDDSGSWSYLQPYGYVWYPRVEPGWRPYYQGRWLWRRHVGWSFAGGNRWTWATHHYGRWGVAPSGSWFWIPGNQWSASWVQWAVAPGYVSWCPLGWNDAPVGRFWSNRTEGHRRSGESRGWTVVRAGTFTTGANASRHAIDPASLATTSAPPFVVQSAPPLTPTTRGTFGVVGRTVDTADSRTVATEPIHAVPRGPRVVRTPEGDAPPVVYYRGGTVTTGDARNGRTHEPVAGIPRGEMYRRHEGARDTSTSQTVAIPGTQPPPIPYRNGPPIIAVPRATVPGMPGGPSSFHTGRPVMGTPPGIAAPPPLIAAPPAIHPARPAPAPAPAPTPAPAPPPPPPPPPAHSASGSNTHATASPRSGPH